MDQQFVEGMTVYDAAGEKIGTVGDDAGPGYLDVRKGWLFPKDFYAPVSVIQRTDGNGVYLSISKDELLHNPQYDLDYEEAYEQTFADDPPDEANTPVSGTIARCDTGAAPASGRDTAGGAGQTTLNRADTGAIDTKGDAGDI